MRRTIAVLFLLSTLSMYADHPSEAPEGYVRYLVPVIAHGRPGAGGSVWVAEWAAFNAGQTRTFVWGPFPYLSLSPPVQDNDLDTKETKRLFLDEPSAGFDGGYVYVADADIASLSMSVRVRDTSVNAQSYGARIPMVRDDAFANTVRLIEIPTDAGYRVTLRLYGYTSDTRTAHVRIYDRESHLLEERDVQLHEQPTHGIIDAGDPSLRPAYVAFDPLSDAVRAATPFVRVEVTSGLEAEPTSRIWAFASITHNATQQVSIVTPD